ncbi:hypothetical protein GIB67_037087 [Kingdonia uniflora]|uniref:Inositol-tetrakisphosphate 1-kinase N-terminal domain-containing protein n=1 Tax=Kingdonia uniflora TaxID=39325 RepID=A0A7J7LI03_9MAGN|nr:hypothetical protein GIB67_037087 [Kingdonia uniflora]
MKLNGEISLCEDHEQDETQSENNLIELSTLQQHPQKLFVVGYALTSKKTKSFLQPKLESLARKKGILFVAIDRNIALSDQGPFDILLHKLSGKEWGQVLEVKRRGRGYKGGGERRGEEKGRRTGAKQSKNLKVLKVMGTLFHFAGTWENNTTSFDYWTFEVKPRNLEVLLSA